MYLTYKDAGKALFLLFVAGWLGWVTAIGIYDGWLPVSNEKPQGIIQSSEFMITVLDDGTSVITAAHHASGAVKNIIGNAYPTPEAAEEAISGVAPEKVTPLPGWLVGIYNFFGIKPAEAHAVKVCTHQDGVVSNQDGGGYHITNFRFHDNGRHYTRTDHKTLTINGYITTDTFYYSVSRDYCNCW